MKEKMKNQIIMKNIFYLIAVVVGLMVARNATATEPMQMTMTLQPKGKVSIAMAGTGTMTIDWGDGTTNETHTLEAFDKEARYTDLLIDQSKYRCSHTYSGSSTRTITIIGENITHLRCPILGLTSLDISSNTKLIHLDCAGNDYLTSLDVSSNAELIYLDCAVNYITSLDISKNAKLEHLDCCYNELSSLNVSKNNELKHLDCSGNELSSLEVSKNTELTFLKCSNNQLANLDMSMNTRLYYLNLIGNQLSIEVLNAIFGMLHNNIFSREKRIIISSNPGTDACNQSIATDKEWLVITDPLFEGGY